MEYAICITLLFIAMFLLKFVFNSNMRNIKELERNEELESITDKFPENVDIANEILDLLEKQNSEKSFYSRPKIEQAENTKTSLYIAITNKILIADMKNNYARIQTIAHECIHSNQNRKLLLSNFIISNINIAYFITTILLTLFKVIPPNMLQIFILTFLLFIQFAIRSYLEIDAMIRAKYLAKEYIEIKELITKEQEEKLLTEYDKINKTGIPFVINHLLTNACIKVLICAIIGVLIK